MKQFYLLYGEQVNGKRDESIHYCLKPTEIGRYASLEMALDGDLYESIGYIPLLSIPKDAWTKNWMKQVVACIWNEQGILGIVQSLDHLKKHTREQLLEIIKEEINL